MTLKSNLKSIIPERQWLALRRLKKLQTIYRYPIARAIAARQLRELRALPNSPFEKKPAAGHLRGIDFYNGTELTLTLARSLEQYHRYHHAYPNLVAPKGLCEHIFQSKFLKELKVPESGNKLLTESFIPPELRATLRCPRIIWHSSKPKLPPNEDVPPGDYYMKANHGSGLFRRITYPLTTEARVELESLCVKWLRHNAGVKFGEWHYSAFQKEILLQERVGTEAELSSWNCFTFSGAIEFVSVHKKSQNGRKDHATWLEADLNPSEHQRQGMPRIPAEEIAISEGTKAQIRAFALAVGKKHGFVRIDFFLDDKASLYLAEMTFFPSNALLAFPKEIDQRLGTRWRD